MLDRHGVAGGQRCLDHVHGFRPGDEPEDGPVLHVMQACRWPLHGELAKCSVDRLGECVGVQVGATAFLVAMTSKEVTTREVKGDPGVVYKIRVRALAMRSAARTNIGAHSSLAKRKLSLHAHGDVLLELGEDLHWWIEDLVCGDVLAKEESPITPGGARQAIPRRVLHNVGVPVQGRHGERCRPDDEAGSGTPVSEEELELEDEDDEGGDRRWWMSAARRTKSSR